MILATGILLIVVPLAFNAAFFALQRSFDYPAILRRSNEEVLERFHSGGTRLRALWYGFAFSALLFVPVPVLMQQLFPAAPWYLPAATVIGVLAGVMQLIGLLRWSFLVPVLANVWKDPQASAAHKDAAEVVFEAFHKFVGGGIGEHLGYVLTAVWTLLISIAIIQTHLVSVWLAGLGIVAGVGILIGVLEEANLKWAAAVNAVAYVVWSIWLLAMGVRVLFLHA